VSLTCIGIIGSMRADTTSKSKGMYGVYLCPTCGTEFIALTTNVQYTIVTCIDFEHGGSAYSVEQEALACLTSYRYRGSKVLNKTGNTEIFTVDPTDTIRMILERKQNE